MAETYRTIDCNYVIPVQLRPDVLVRIYVPVDDLKKAEAEKIARIIQAFAEDKS